MRAHVTMHDMNRGNNQHKLFRRLAPVMALGFGLVAMAPAGAEPANARLFKAQFGYMPSCNGCHVDGGGSPLNPYGKAFKEARANVAAFAQIAAADADGDGISNQDEAVAKANPGDPGSTPKSPGGWLEMSQLIPKQVQQAFPEARLYKPIDAILTEAERAKARDWGVSLEAEDDNTIYVPVIERKPAGTAVIVRGNWGDQVFFLLVTTTRQLTLERVIPIAGDGLPKAGSAELNRWSGASAAAFPTTPDGDSLDAALAATVHRALALIEARLKK